MLNDTEKLKKPLDMALRYLSYQPRTILEVERYVEKKGYDADIVKQIIDILLEKNYLNDKEFAQLFVESKVKKKPKSKFALGYELRNKGVSGSIIDDVLSPYSDDDLALISVKFKIKTWQHLDPEKFKRKMLNFLQYRGFNYEISMSTLDHFKQPD